MEHRIKVWYKAQMNAGYQRTQYRTKTIHMAIPVDKIGFYLFDILTQNINAYFISKVLPTIDNAVGITVTGWQIVDNY